MEIQFSEDLKLVNEIMSLENTFLQCIINLEEYYKNYKIKVEKEHLIKSKDIYKIMKENPIIYKEKYIEANKELQKYKKNMEMLVKLSKPLISEDYMKKLLREQKVIRDTISNISNINN
jgi:hypothetical protein